MLILLIIIFFILVRILKYKFKQRMIQDAFEKALENERKKQNNCDK